MKSESRLIENLKYNLGETIMSALNDSDVVEIILNSDGLLWIEKVGRNMENVGRMDATQGKLVIALVASSLETVVTAQNPIVEGELLIDGSRFEGALPPVCSSPTFVIRKRANRIFPLLSYAEDGIMPKSLIDVFHNSLKKRENILVVGGTGSGKTTFVNALIQALSELCPDDRLVILEDTMELQSSSVNSQFFRTSDTVDMTKLLRMTMRIRPDRIIIGEVRDGAALALLKAWNTGHPGGIATVHANGAEEGLYRLEELIAEATAANKQKLIGNAVSKIIFMERAPGGRQISEVLDIYGFDEKTGCYNMKSVYNLSN